MIKIFIWRINNCSEYKNTIFKFCHFNYMPVLLEICIQTKTLFIIRYTENHWYIHNLIKCLLWDWPEILSRIKRILITTQWILYNTFIL